MTNGRDLRGERLTIVGAGAIGGTVGAYLDDAGYDVLLVDANPAHVTVVKERGLKITGCRGEKTFRPRIVLPEDLNGSLGAVFLCVKGHHTASAMDQIAPQLAPKGWILSLQNGLNETQIAERVGSARTVGAFVHFGADLLEPGLIQLGYEATIRVGELGGSFTPRLEALKTTLGYAMPCEITDNVWGYLWGKLVFGSLGFLVSCVDAPVAEVVEDPLGRALCREVCTEAYLVARTQTEKVEPIGGFDPEAFAPGACRNKRADGALDALADAWRHSLKQHMGIWRDLRVKRRKTEVDEQVARVVATGGEERVPVPVNEAVLGVVHDIEEGRRGMGWENLEEISRRAGYY